MDNPRKRAAKFIIIMEKEGGIHLQCGCFLGMPVSDMRRLMELAGPKAILESVNLIECDIHIKKDIEVKSKKKRLSEKNLR